MGSSSTANAYAFAARGNDLYVGGDFSKPADTYTNNIAYWDEASSDWQKLTDVSKEKGIYDGNIAVVAGSGNAIYAGGSFKIAGGARANSIAK